jgi:hypothetical protein
VTRPATDAEKILLRSDNQRADLYLYVHKPKTVFSCQVSVTPITQDQAKTLTYNNPTGNAADVWPGMTLKVGTTPGASDLGRLRVRSIDADTSKLNFGETSEIVWVVGQYLTIVEDFQIWARRLDFKGGVWNLEGELKYTDQHKIMDPVPVLGPAFAMLPLNGTAVFKPDASPSWVPDGTVTGWAWLAPGASATSGLDTATPDLTYDQVGTYRVTCSVTAANGKTASGHRFVCVYDPNVIGITQFSLDNASGDFEAGGWSFNLNMFDQASLVDVQDQATVVLFARDWYGSTQTSIGPVPGYENVIAIGRIDGQTIEQAPDLSSVKFSVRGPAWWMANTASWPVSVLDDEKDPTDWMHIKGLTIDKGIWHLVHWRSTVDLSTDVYPTGDTRRAFDCSGNLGTLLEQLNAFCEAKIGAKAVADRYGRIQPSIDPQLRPLSEREAIQVVLDITKADWTGSVQIEKRTYPVSSLLETAAFCYQGGKWTPVLSRSPGNAMRINGGMRSRYNLVAYSQDQLNVLTGMLAAKDNNPYLSVTVHLASNFRLADIAPGQYLTLSLAAGDTPLGLVWDRKRFIPNRVTFLVDPESGGLLTDIEGEVETSGTAGVSVIPPDPPIPNVQPQPPVELPPWTPFPGGGWPDVTPQIPGDTNPLPEDGCRGDPGAEANGPFAVPFGALLTDIDVYTKTSPLHGFIRAGSASNPTRYTINGFWQENVESVWSETNTDDWYNVYGLDRDGNRVATGVHDPVTNPAVRTGIFNPPAGVEIWNIEIALTWPRVFQPDTASAYVEPTTVASVEDPGTIAWSYLGPGIVVDWMSYKFTTKYSQPLSVITLTNSTPQNYYHMWFRATGWAQYYSQGLVEQPSWEDWAGFLSWNDIGTGFKIDKDYQRKVWGADNYLTLAHHIAALNSPYPWDPSYSYIGNMHLYIAPMPSHKINVTTVLLWNICG